MVVKKNLVKRQGKPGTDEVVKEVWWGKKISTDHPSQPQGFGIGEMLTGALQREKRLLRRLAKMKIAAHRGARPKNLGR